MSLRNLDEGGGSPRIPILAALLGLIYLQGVTGFQAEGLRRGFRWLSTPVRTPLVAIRGVLHEGIARMAASQSLLVRLGRLESELQEARLSRRLGEERCQQAERVEALLQSFRMAEPGHSDPPILARVVAWSAQPQEWRIQLDRGAADGIRLDGPVVHGENLLGRIIEVGPRESRVLLVQDAASALGILLLEDRTPGVASGIGEPWLRLSNLPPGSRQSSGERVLTGSLSAYYPKGLLVGTLTLGEDGAPRVLPAVDPHRIEEVLVLAPAGRANSRATPGSPNP